MGEEIMKKTRDTLGKIIKKPPLTDKLLSKPPFRFLHDIFTEVIRTTGFLNGLFTSSEMDSKNVSAKEDKMAFLQKVIDVVSIVSGDQLAARPSKIVAGHEPEKTNELLQAIAKCIHKNVSSDDAVQQVLTGKKTSSKVQEKPPTGSSKKKEGKENRERPDEQRRKKKDRDEKPEREKSSDRRKRSAGKERRERSRDKESNKEQGAGEGNEEKESVRSRDKSRDKDRHKEERSRDRRERKRREEDVERNEMESEGREREIDGEEERPQAPDNQEEQAESNEKPASSRPPRPASAKGHRRRPAPDRGSRGAPVEGQDSSPSDRARSRPARPPSARPAAPRVRQRPDAAEEEIARMESAGRQRTAPIIVDRGSRPAGKGMSSSEDEDEQFLVQEEDVQPPEMGKLSPMLNGNVNGDVDEEGEHGGLVRKILETKKELETSAAKGTNAKRKTEIERSPVNEVQRRKERELVMRDIEKLRGSVQKLCRSAVPLGKIIDYIQEDMDSMQNELIQWKKENKQHAAKLKEEESITTKTIEPLQAELEELDRNITSQLDMIAASKCNVIRNQEKIDKMVAGVTAQS
uniref:TRAF3-interacting protein 1-like isoform X3 n=1 Tax=Styela clava TaxID=7725 RepID=UPI0019396839|nr:TRAF3-interacting protein 1-like isoform X3 [Styela clava]